MIGISCDTCGERLRVNVTGGTFYIREGSTIENINFKRAEDTKIITRNGPEDEPKLDESPEMSIEIVCSSNSDHLLFAHTVNEIKIAIYTRIGVAASKIIKKLTG